MQIKKSDIIEIIKEELQAALAEGSYEDEVFGMEKDMERHMADKARRRMSQPSTRPYTPPSDSKPRPEIDMKDLMRSVQDQIRAAGGNVKVKITDKETGEVTEF